MIFASLSWKQDLRRRKNLITLNKAIEKLKNNGVHIHSALETAFTSLYAYTCNEKGIRHAGIEFVGVPAENAKYLLVSF